MVDLLKFLNMMLLDICEDMGHIMSFPLSNLFFFYFQFWKKLQNCVGNIKLDRLYATWFMHIITKGGCIYIHWD